MIFYLPESEKKSCRPLYEAVFTEDSNCFVEHYFQKNIRNNKVMVSSEDNEIVSMLHINPHFLQVKQDQLYIPYIYAVATQKNFRKKGHMGRLMEHTLQDLYQEEIPFTYLIPVSSKVYEPYGFSFVSTRRQKKFVLKEILSEIDGSSVNAEDQFRLAIWDSQDKIKKVEELADFVNNQLEAVSSCYIVRNADYFSELMNQLECEKGIVSILYKKEEPVGYCFLDGANPRNIWELVCKTDYQNYFIKLLCETLCLEQIVVKNNLRQAFSVLQEPFVMGRIVNLNQFAKYISAKREMELIIRIHDKKIEKNSGTYLWTLNQKGSFFEKVDKLPQVTLEIGTLTGWLFGYMDLQMQLEDEILIKLNDIVLLEHFFINDEV